MNRGFQQAFRGKVFAENRCGQLPARQLSLPIVVVFERITVDGLILAPVDREVCLAVSVQVELTQSDAAIDRLFKDSRGHGSPMPCRLSRKPGAHRDQLHLRLSFPSWSLSDVLDNCPYGPVLATARRNILFWMRGSLRRFTFPGNRNLRDQIQVTVSKQVVHTRRKSVIMALPKTETEHG